MNSTTVKVSKRYQIALPSEVRRILSIEAGDRLLVDVQDGVVVLVVKPDDYVERLAGLHKEIWADTDVTRYIQEERDAWTAEDDSPSN